MQGFRGRWMGRTIYLTSPEYMASFTRKAGKGWRNAGGWVLRYDSELYAGDEECAARDGCDGERRAGDGADDVEVRR